MEKKDYVVVIELINANKDAYQELGKRMKEAEFYTLDDCPSFMYNINTTKSNIEIRDLAIKACSGLADFKASVIKECGIITN